MPYLSEAFRELGWNISGIWLMYALFVAALAVLAFGTVRNIARWRKGRPDPARSGNWPSRLRFTLVEVFWQRRVRGSFFPGLFHSLIFYSFLILVVTTTLVFLDEDFGTHIFQGYVYVFFTVAAELAGLLLLVGLAMAAWRRLVSKPKTLDTGSAEILPLVLIFLIVLTGFLVEGLRIATVGDPWKPLSFVGALFAPLFGGLSDAGARSTHKVLWWTHTVLAMGWIALLPYGRFLHVLALPVNVFFHKTEPHGTLCHKDIEAMMTAPDFDEANFCIGTETSAQLTWKQRMDSDACIRCGRCEEVCPPFLAGQEFSAKRLVLGIGEAMDTENGEPVPIVGTAFDKDFIWSCLTCMACVEVCPAMIEHVDTAIDVRRNEVVMKAQLPTDAANALRLMETGGNPFANQAERTDWIAESGMRVVAPGEKCEVLYFIGCATTFDPEKHRIAEDLAALMKEAGVDFGVLGGDETCCGDPARVMGQEYLFQTVAKGQVAALQQREFDTLLVSCPHCYNVLQNEYAAFGGDFKVVHHSEFLRDLVAEGRLKPAAGNAGKTVFHDPCYLGRYQRVFDAPREVLRSIPGTELGEMENHGADSLCCGGGGGHSWIDLEKGERINNLRVKQAEDAQAETLAVACPFCMQMLSDSIKLLDLDEKMKIADIATVMAAGLKKESEG